MTTASGLGAVLRRLELLGALVRADSGRECFRALYDFGPRLALHSAGVSIPRGLARRVLIACVGAKCYDVLVLACKLRSYSCSLILYVVHSYTPTSLRFSLLYGGGSG